MNNSRSLSVGKLSYTELSYNIPVRTESVLHHKTTEGKFIAWVILNHPTRTESNILHFAEHSLAQSCFAAT